MGFLSYCLGYYRQELQALEAAPAAEAGIAHARRLLCILDDLAAEGYTALNERLEAEQRGISRLRAYLHRTHAEPFSFSASPLNAAALPYSAQEAELRCAIQDAVHAARAVPALSSPFADELERFCRWIGYDENTAYIFLLRDTLLPFVRFLAQGRARIYPWLLSRRAFAALTGQENADDAIRAAIYKALGSGCTDFPSFLRLVLPDMRRTLDRYPQARDTLRAMLAEIDAERIVVVESGCAGTFPLLLMSLDERADMRMFTAYPYLTGIFSGRLFTERYEENRLLETMASQALFFRFSGIRDGRFYVQKCLDPSAEAQALAEIRRMLRDTDGSIPNEQTIS